MSLDTRTRPARFLALLFLLGAACALALSLPAAAGAATTVTLTEAGFSRPVGTWDPATRSATLTADIDALEVRIGDVDIHGDGHFVHVAGSATPGVAVSGRSGVRIHDLHVDQAVTGVTFTDCVRCSFDSGQVLASDTCVRVTGGSYDAISDSNLAYSSPAPEGAHGVDARQTAHLLLKGNVLGQANIRADSAPYLVIQGNEVAGGGTWFTEIQLSRASHATIRGNRVSGKVGGMELDSSCRCTVAGNDISGGYGSITFKDASSNVFTHNSVTVTPLRFVSSSRNTVYNNDFWYMAGPPSADRASSGNLFNLPAPLGGNWWSDWTGPDVNGNGFVDKPYRFTGGVDRLPWVTADAWPARQPPRRLIRLR